MLCTECLGGCQFPPPQSESWLLILSTLIINPSSPGSTEKTALAKWSCFLAWCPTLYSLIYWWCSCSAICTLNLSFGKTQNTTRPKSSTVKKRGVVSNWCLCRHQCDLPERFGKNRLMNRKFDQCISQKDVTSRHRRNVTDTSSLYD